MLSIVQLHNPPVSDQLGLIRPVDRGQVRLEVLLVLGQLDHLPWWQRFSSFVIRGEGLTCVAVLVHLKRPVLLGSHRSIPMLPVPVL